MTYFLSDRSLRELDGVHADLVATARAAIVATTQDFSVHDGLRTVAEQEEYVRRGVSKTMNSKHLPQGDGWGHAIDLVPWINGQYRWEWPPIYHIASAVWNVANDLHVRLRWGGVWDREFGQLDGTPEGLERAVNDYAARRRAAGKTAFLDGPHYEMIA